MVLDSNVCQPPVPVVDGNNVRLAVLAVTLAEGWLVWAYPLTAARLSATIATMNGLFFTFIMFPFLLEPYFWEDRAEPVLELGFSVLQHNPYFPTSLLLDAQAPKRLPSRLRWIFFRPECFPMERERVHRCSVEVALFHLHIRPDSTTCG